MISYESVPIRCDVPWRHIDGNALVVKPREGVTYPLNTVATRIWLLSDGTRRVAEILDTLVEEFEGEADEIRRDALLFLEELQKVSLIQSRPKER